MAKVVLLCVEIRLSTIGRREGKGHVELAGELGRKRKGAGARLDRLIRDYVRCWHIAVVPLRLTNVCFWGNSGR
jgi:hypothetical protein